MLSNSEKDTLDKFLKELGAGQEEQARLAERVHRIESAIRGLLALTDDEKEFAEYTERLESILKPTGLTDAIRKVFRKDPKMHYSATAVQDKVERLGFSLSGYSNSLASIHTILKRLVKAGQIKQVKGATGTLYRASPTMWKTEGNQ
jgi:hypothetical protein